MSRKLLPLNPRQMVGLADGNSFYCSFLFDHCDLSYLKNSVG